MEYAQQNQEHTGHDGSHEQARFAVLLDDTIDDDDKSTRRAADLHTAPAEQGHGQSGNDGVMMPFSGVTPEAMPKAMANGRATIPTMSPAMMSTVSFSLL